MLQKAGVVVVLGNVHPVGKAERHIQPHPVVLFILAVPAGALRRPVLHRGQRVCPRQLGGIIADAVFVAEVLLLKTLFLLELQDKFHPGVDHCLPLQHVGIVFQRNVDVGKDLQVRLPADPGAGLPAGVGLGLQPADVFALFEVQAVPLAVPQHLHIHVLRRILRRAGTQAVQAQGVLIAAVAAAVVLAAGIQLAKDQLPVVALLLGVIVHRAAAAKILHLYAAVGKAGDDDPGAVALPRLVYGVGEDLEHRMLAALQPVRTENDPRPLADPVGALQRGDAFVAVFFFTSCSHAQPPYFVGFCFYCTNIWATGQAPRTFFLRRFPALPLPRAGRGPRPRGPPAAAPLRATRAGTCVRSRTRVPCGRDRPAAAIRGESGGPPAGQRAVGGS